MFRGSSEKGKFLEILRFVEQKWSIFVLGIKIVYL